MGNKVFSFLLLCCITFFTNIPDLHAIMVGQKLDLGGYLQNETALSLQDSGNALWCENKVLVYGTYNFNNQIRAFVRIQGYYDAINGLQSTDYRDISDERYLPQETSFRKNLWQPKTYTTSEVLKEIFVEFDLPDFDLRIGKQQFAWGVTDGIKVLDIVYPQDFRKFNQEDFEESRIPLWSMKFDYYVGSDSEIQLVYIPNFEPAFFPGGGHPFATWDNEFFDVLDVTGVEVGGPFPHVDFDVFYDEPDDTFDKGEFGVMWRQNLGDWSYSLNFLSHFTDVKGAYQTAMTTESVTVGPDTFIVPNHIELTLKNNRMYSVGGSFDTTLSRLPCIGTIILRAEGIYNFDNIMINVPESFTIDLGGMGVGPYVSNFMPVPVVGPSGGVVWDAGVPFPETVEIDDWTYALGFDKYLFTDYFLSFQFVHHHIMDYKSTFINPITGNLAEENDYWATLLLQKDWMNEKMWTKVLNVVGRHGDHWIQPQISYLFREKFKLTVQGNIYGGAPNCMWSRFDGADNIAFRLTYQF